MSENQMIGLAEAARMLSMQAQSVRARLYREGSLWGVQSHRAPNNRILFRADEIRALVKPDEVRDDFAE